MNPNSSKMECAETQLGIVLGTVVNSAPSNGGMTWMHMSRRISSAEANPCHPPHLQLSRPDLLLTAAVRTVAVPPPCLRARRVDNGLARGCAHIRDCEQHDSKAALGRWKTQSGDWGRGGGAHLDGAAKIGDLGFEELEVQHHVAARSRSAWRRRAASPRATW
jgi:hypothetical protein